MCNRVSRIFASINKKIIHRYARVQNELFCIIMLIFSIILKKKNMFAHTQNMLIVYPITSKCLKKYVCRPHAGEEKL